VPSSGVSNFALQTRLVLLRFAHIAFFYELKVCGNPASVVGKILSNNIACYREIFRETKSQLIWQISLSYFKKFPQPPQLLATTALIKATSTSRQIDYDSLKLR
jgi:hypothetical protein